MSPLQVALSAFEFVLTAALSMLVIYAQHRMYVITNHDYDTIDEIKKGLKDGTFVILNRRC